jgi:hypothetical protein
MSPLSPYQFIYTDIDAATLRQIYDDVLVHIYLRDVRINGPIPAGVATPDGVRIIDCGDHHLVYHISREIILADAAD